MVMHYGGYWTDMPAWRDLADEFGLLLFEDAAHVAGLPGVVGTLSDAASFSFFTNKNMTTAEGGMMIVRDDDRRSRARLLRAHGMTASTLDRDSGRAVGYDVVECGHNYRMDELRAAMGLVQLERLLEWNETRRTLTAEYRKLLNQVIPEVVMPFDDEHLTTAHILPVLLPIGADRRAVMANMRATRVQTSMHYPPIHQFDYYVRTYGDVSLPHTERYCDDELTLPLHARLTTADVDRVVRSLHEALTATGGLNEQ
jgi:dTDP-4-amino-4,6-dideoxygalactose transaminase